MGTSASSLRYTLFGAVLRVLWLSSLAFCIWYGGAFVWDIHESRSRIESIKLSLQAGQAVVLGRHELAAPLADIRHIRVWRDEQEHWFLSNVSAQRQVAWSTKGEEGQLRHTLLNNEQTVWVVGQPWVLRIEQHVLWMQKRADSTRKWRFDGVSLTPFAEGVATAQIACVDESWVALLRTWWNLSVPALAREIKVDWGGTLACGNRIAGVALPQGQLRLARTAQGYALQGDAAAARQVCLVTPEQGICPSGATLYEQSLRLQNGLYITLGRTRMLTSFEGERLMWKVVARGGWIPLDAQPPQPVIENVDGTSTPMVQPTIHWDKTTFSPWALPVTALDGLYPLWIAAAVLLVFITLSTLYFQHTYRTTYGSALGLTFSSLCLFAAVCLWVMGVSASPGLSLVVVGAVIASIALLPGATGWCWASHAMLATMLVFGLALQWTLGMQAVDAGGWLFLQKTSAFGACALSSLGVVAWWQATRERSLLPVWQSSMFWWELLLLGLGILAVLGLAAQVVWGGEGGVWGFQPVELAKLALLMLGAHALALKLDWTARNPWHSLALGFRFVLPVLLFAVLAGVALLMVHDYSPVLLMMVWLVGMLSAWAVAASSVVTALLVLLIIGTAVVGLSWLHSTQGVDWMQANGFYGERFAVWVDLFRHPHSGEQLMRALTLATQGGWTGNSLVPAWRVPAVQDDMAPAFLVGRFGLVAALVLWMVQMFYVVCLLMLGWRALRTPWQGDYQQRWSQRMVFFSTTGAAALFAGHILLSWGTNTGWLPVMGQPMPLVSAGGSILVLLLIPLHLFWQIHVSQHAVPGK